MSDIPSSKGADDAILQGEVVISERCPYCGARWAYPWPHDINGNELPKKKPTGMLTCGDCYNEFEAGGE